jgi:hypothetical protein
MSRHSGICDAATWTRIMKTIKAPLSAIEEGLRALARIYLKFEISEISLFNSPRILLFVNYDIYDEPYSYKQHSKTILDKKRRNAYRPQLFYRHNCKVWFNIENLINAAAVGDISPDPFIRSIKLFVDEEKKRIERVYFESFKYIPSKIQWKDILCYGERYSQENGFSLSMY